MTPGQVVLFAVGTVIIIFSAYYVTYYVGVKSAKLRRGAGRSIILRDRFSVSKDKSFCLVEICGKVYVVGVTNNSITLLDTLTVKELEQDEIKRGQQETSYPGGMVASSIADGLAGLFAQAAKKRRGRAERKSDVEGTFADRLKTAARIAGEQNGEDGETAPETTVSDTDKPSGPEGTR